MSAKGHNTTSSKHGGKAASPGSVHKHADNCTCGQHTKIDGVMYRYPKGMTSSYTLDYQAKDIPKQLPFFNYNTYQSQKLPHKTDFATSNKVNFPESQPKIA